MPKCQLDWNCNSARKQQGARTDLTLAQNGLKLNTAEELGKQYGVDEKTIRRDAEFSKVVDKITEEVGEEAKRAILSGKANSHTLNWITNTGTNPETIKYI